MFSAITGIFAWMNKNPIVMLLGIFAVMFVMVVISKNNEIADLRKTNDEKTGRIEFLQTGLITARNNITALNASLEKQNAGITALRQQGEKSGMRFDELIAALASDRATISRKIDAIDKAQPGPDRCLSALELLKGAAQ